jgi:uncharacterized protein YfaS (alpha-2-macroglobulin family)
MKRLSFAVVWVVLCLFPTTIHAQSGAPATRSLRGGVESGLTVVSNGPVGNLTSPQHANEIRIVFSEPMVTLGKIPDVVQAPFVRIAPAVSGSFRWSGTTILIFTPERPLPFSTRYEVTIGTTATAVSGRKLEQPYTFDFTTPTVRLERVRWYRRGGTVDSRIVLMLSFNQPVRSADVAAALSARFEPHQWTPPSVAPDPSAAERYNAKVRQTQTAAALRTPVTLQPTTNWNQKTFPPSPQLLAFEVVTDVDPEAWLRLTLAGTVRSPAGPATPGVPQSYTVETENAFFIDGFYCTAQCDPDARNAVRFRSRVNVEDFAKAITVVDSAGGKPIARPPSPDKPRDPDEYYEEENALTLEDAGYQAQPPDRRYTVAINSDLKSADGQVLGYTWAGSVENWHRSAFTSFGDGQGVWETGGGSLLPFYARNFQDVTQWVAPVQPSELMDAVQRSRRSNFFEQPPAGGITRKLGVAADRIQSHGLDVSKALSAGGTGVLWAALREGTAIPRARRFEIDGDPVTRSSLVQVTNLGITVKDSPQNTLVFVTRLDNGSPVAGAQVSIVRTDNTTHWRGATDADGIALAPNTPLRDADQPWQFSFIVIAEKDGDVAYVGSDWNEGISNWEFGVGYDLLEAAPLLRGSVFTDRGVYRLGEEVHFKAILRHNTPDGVRLLPVGTPVFITLRDAQNKIVDERTVQLSAWSSAEWTWKLPDTGSLGNYSLRAILESDRPKPVTDPENLARGRFEMGEDYRTYRKSVGSSFLVAAYRRPDFRVDVTLTGATKSPLAGEKLRGVVNARYLFGAAMPERPMTWSYTASRAFEVPSEITEKYSTDRWVFVGWDWSDDNYRSRRIAGAETSLTSDGQLALELDTESDGMPQRYQLEGDVEDVSRQHIANRASVLVHSASFYVGVKALPYFTPQKAGLQTEIVAVGLDGKPVGGIPVELTLTQLQWKSVRRAEGDGFYTWDTERVEIPSGTWNITTAEQPVPLHAAIATGGYFRLEAKGTGPDGRFATTRATFYVIGEGYTAWQRFDHNRIELTPEKQTWKPGETARIMIQSPWESATALVTTEREGIRSQRQFPLTSTMQTVSVPITERDIPNVFVSVVLVKGRTSAAPSETSQVPDDKSAEDPGKPSFRMGYVELKVEDRAKRLTVSVKANREEYRPASAANVRIDVKDHQGRGTASEVTLWAVDYGVLSLTGYRTPDVLESVHVRKALQVMNADNRQRIISRRVLTPKGSTEGGGGGADAGAGTLRKDFRVLAFWLGSVTTGNDGSARLNVKLPESLTTYRIMAVAADRASRFGSADTEVRTNKPLTLKPTFPRFMTVGDRAYFGAVVGSQLKSGGTATVTMKSLDPGVLELIGATQQQVLLGPSGNIEVRFEARGTSIGRARLQMTARLGNETDSFEDTFPVEVQLTPETVAAYGETTSATASETLTVPAGVVPGFGGLNLELASTALVGLSEGARYLVEYPYGCAEQRSSKARALMLAADLGEAFSLSEMTPAQMRPAAQQTLAEIERFQCDNGGFSFWPGNCSITSPYLAAYLLQTLKTGVDLKYRVDPAVLDRGYRYLESSLRESEPINAGWLPSYLAWQAFAVKVLAEGGRTQDSHVTRLYGHRQRMPVFAIAFLHDAMTARKETGTRIEELRRRMLNSILQEAGSAHVDDFNDPDLAWFWHSNARTTGIVLNSFVKGGVSSAPIRQMVRWLMLARDKGRWGNTQENAYAMEALVNYYRRYEAEPPNFTAAVKLGEKELTRAQFQGRSTDAQKQQLPMTQMLAAAPAGSNQPLTFSREGTGTLFYTARLRYAIDQFFNQGLDAGFKVERRYELFEGADGSTPTTLPPNDAKSASLGPGFQAGDLVRVTLTFQLPKERRFVAVTDPLPAGFEAVESWFETTKSSLAQQTLQYGERSQDSWRRNWGVGYFDHVERHDDRLQLFATSLSEGSHTFSYVVRATTSGTFRTAPTRVEEMYSPEIFGRTASTQIEVRR